MLRILAAIALLTVSKLNAEPAAVVPADVYYANHAALDSAPQNPTSQLAAKEICCSECLNPGWWFNGDALFWNAHMRSLDYAATEDGTSLAIGVGQNHRVGFDRDTGFRTELGYLTKVGWGVSVSYTNFSAEGNDAVTRPPGIGQLFTTISHPGGPEEANDASAYTSLDFSLFELVARSRVVDRRFQSVDLLGGVRWANIDHALQAQFDGRDFVNGQIRDRLAIDAAGILFGAETHWRLAGGWSLFGRGTLGLLYGRFSNYRFESNLNDFEQLVNFRDDYVEPIFNFDARLGIGKQIGCVQLRTGYDLNLWTGVGDRLRFDDDIEESSFGVASGNLLLEGLFFQASINW